MNAFRLYEGLRPRAPCFKRRAVRGLLALAAMLAAVPVVAQTESTPVQLTGTLAKVRDSGSITIGHRTSSIPFSYLSARGEPIGYSIDLCKLLVEAIGDEVGRELAIKWQPVTSESRIASITSGQSDLECGSTTSNLERRKVVSFSPVIFVSGTKLLVKKGSPIRSYRDLGGRKVAVTAGTTNEAALRVLSDKQKLGINIITARDHAQSLETLVAGRADAFAIVRQRPWRARCDVDDQQVAVGAVLVEIDARKNEGDRFSVGRNLRVGDRRDLGHIVELNRARGRLRLSR